MVGPGWPYIQPIPGLLDTMIVPIAAIVAAVALASWLDLRLFGRGKPTPSFREAVAWSIGWVVVALLAGVVLWSTRGGEEAVLYLTVYMIERSLSLDNVFVFLLLFTYFSVEPRFRGRLIVWGVILALVLRGLAILGGVALLERFDWLLYVLGVGLLVLAIRVAQGMGEGVDPDRNLLVRVVRRLFPVETRDHGGRWVLRRDGAIHVTPLFLCLAGIIFADIVFAVDSIPAAFAITREPLVIWMGNVFALLGLRALLVLVERLIERFRYLDQTIALVLGVIAVKLIVEEAGLVHVGPLQSLGVIALLFAGGITLSLVADRGAVRPLPDPPEPLPAPEPGEPGR